jgi:dethiobiotin synthase
MAAKQRFLVVTGTGTGVGKTVLSGLLVRRIIRLGRTIRAFKPLCSGGRGDALALEAASGGAQTLDEINPWHFEAPLSPALAAVVGDKPLPRTEIVSKLWVYIKAKGLQDKANKRMVNADDKLKAVFGKAQVSMFEMAGLIGKHVK